MGKCAREDHQALPARAPPGATDSLPATLRSKKAPWISLSAQACVAVPISVPKPGRHLRGPAQ